MKLWLRLAFSLFIGLPLLPAPAAAESSVVVLGLRSLDGEDDQARAITAALRDAARKSGMFRVSDRDVSLAQMSLAHGCDEPDARCMADIASTLRVDRLIYGTTVRSGADLSVTLLSFDAVTGKVDGSIEQKLPNSKLAPATLPTTAAQLMDRLTGRTAPGSLRVIGDSPGAEVLVDGEPAGTLDARGELLVSPVPAGKHTVSVRDPRTDRSKDTPLVVGENAMATLRVLLKPRVAEPEQAYDDEGYYATKKADEPARERMSTRRILGITSVALAAGFAGATVYGWARLGKISHDKDLEAYRAEFPGPGQPGGTSDVCREARAGVLVNTRNMPDKAGLEANVRSLCEEADTLEVLQYVFLSGALAFGGLGTYLLLTAPKTPKRHVSFQPSFHHGRAMLRAAVQF